MSNIEYKPAEKLQLRLVRQNSSVSWGFRLQGGIDFSTPLSIQSVNPNSVSEQCGLKAGDAILAINTATSDAMTHDDAKAEIMRSGDEIYMLVERGAVKIWKPQVTPLSELRPQELRTIKSATGEDINPVQKTSLAINKPPDEPCTIGSSHNRSAQPFGAPKAAVPNVVHSQYNSPMGMYSANNIADTYSQQTQGIQSQMANCSLDINKPDPSSDQVAEGVTLSESGTDAGVTLPTSLTTTTANTTNFATSSATPISDPSYQSAGDEEESGHSTPILQSRTFHRLQEQLVEEENNNAGNQANSSPGFRSVSAPIAKPPSERPKQPSMTCGGCGMLATGVIVKANGVPYHVACFKCASCSMNLKQKGFFVVDDKLYCEIHAKSHSKPPGPDMVAVPVYR